MGIVFGRNNLIKILGKKVMYIIILYISDFLKILNYLFFKVKVLFF